MVLPAPLGPMTPTISPGPTSTLTPSTAAYAPKATVSSTARSTGAPGSGGRSRPPLRRPCVGVLPGDLDIARPAAPAPRNTERSRSGRSSRSAAAPHEPHLAPFEEDAALGDLEGHVDRLLDHDQRRALAAQVIDEAQQLGDDRRCEPERELVDHQQPGRMTTAMARRASAAGRPTGCRPARRRGRPGPGTARAPWPARRPCRRSRRCSQPATRRFSSTVSDGKMPAPPGICTTRAATWWGASPARASPSNAIVPRRGGTRPEIARSSVDLPAPLVPRSATASPSRTTRSTPRARARRRSRPRCRPRRAAPCRRRACRPRRAAPSAGGRFGAGDLVLGGGDDPAVGLDRRPEAGTDMPLRAATRTQPGVAGLVGEPGQPTGGEQQDGQHADARGQELPLGVEEPARAPKRNSAPSTAPASDVMPPTTTMVSTTRFSIGE